MDFFQYAQHEDRDRLVVKIKSSVSEAEINQVFSAIYRRYKAFHKKKVGENFFKEIDDLVDKLCDDFEQHVLRQMENE
ncbi:hypothetical protein [Shimazuella alba]|uniref:Uncharacterized protein n=1 Tax=Shimazuella alba TaxID=2690964 RepID=A0A6I4W630_9BACL|nr:hypothetical protein [Shimazuella alba]MXQ55772.1 hypothetical protein [Shimazuella alba]